MKTTANNPKATAAQVQRLAKRDLEAALRHPCASLDLLIAHPEKIGIVRQNPVWKLFVLAEPAVCSRFELVAREAAAKGEIDLLCKREGPGDHRRIVAWAVECAGAVSHVWRASHPLDKRPAQAMRAALRWVIAANANAANAASCAAAYAAAAYAAAYAAYAPAAYAAAAYAAAYAAYAPAANAANAAANAAAGSDPEKSAEIREQQLLRLRAYLAGEILWLERVIAHVVGGAP